MNYGGINITKTTVIGIEIKFANISAIFFGLWLFWIYFLIRFYQYFMQEAVPKIKKAFNDLLTGRARSVIENIVISKHPKVTNRTSQIFDYNILIIGRRTKWYLLRVQGNELTGQDKMGGQESRIFNMDIGIWRIWKEILSSSLTLIFNESLITDYIFPIIFAVFSLFYCNLTDWPGSIPSIFL